MKSVRRMAVSVESNKKPRFFGRQAGDYGFGGREVGRERKGLTILEVC